MTFLNKDLKLPFCLTAVYFEYLPYIILGTLSVASSLTAIFLPETFQAPLPQTIEEMTKTNRWAAAGILSIISCVCENLLILFGAFQFRALYLYECMSCMNVEDFQSFMNNNHKPENNDMKLFLKKSTKIVWHTQWPNDKQQKEQKIFDSFSNN